MSSTRQMMAQATTAHPAQASRTTCLSPAMRQVRRISLPKQRDLIAATGDALRNAATLQLRVRHRPDNSSMLFWEVDEPSDIGRVTHPGRPGLTSPAGAESHTVQNTSYIVTEEEMAAIPDFATPVFETEGQIWGANAHMHTRGKAVRIDLLRADGTEECLLDIPEWDFAGKAATGLKNCTDQCG